MLHFLQMILFCPMLLATSLNRNDQSFLVESPAANAEKMQATQMADKVLKKVPILQGKFFQAFHSRQMSLNQFQKTQQQFFFAVNYFSRPMAALVARLPEHAQRISIIENIMEEHGDMDPAKYHSNTFKHFLKSIGTSIVGIKESPSVLAFNLDLMGASMSEEPFVAIGAFGLIEYAFADISADIGKTVVDKGWVQQESLVHYSLHAYLDKKHAEEFFMIVESELDDPVKKAQFQKGLELGAYIFNKLYDDLYEESQTS
jgi:pyrroloquinoline-quinone synthase